MSDSHEPYRIEFFQRERGDYPARDFLDSLPERLCRKASAWLGLLQEKGPCLERPYADVLDGPIRELRVSFGRLEARILYFISGKNIVLSHGFMKKTDKTPAREISRARFHRAEWLRELGGEA